MWNELGWMLQLNSVAWMLWKNATFSLRARASLVVLAVRCQLRMSCRFSSEVPVSRDASFVRCQLWLSCCLSSKVPAAFCCCAILLNVAFSSVFVTILPFPLCSQSSLYYNKPTLIVCIPWQTDWSSRTDWFSRTDWSSVPLTLGSFSFFISKLYSKNSKLFLFILFFLYSCSFLLIAIKLTS
jgi:hypothetical protein